MAPDLAEWGGALRDELTDGEEPLEDWRVTDDGTEDDADGCDDGEARRTYAATIDLGFPRDDDADTPVNRLTGRLSSLGWELSDSVSEPNSGSVTVTRDEDEDDPSGTRLTLEAELSRVPGGWHHEVTVRTDCLPTD
ncbi:hypothetical protein [Nocardioides dongkuii]|uniref:hypothetical protein n=1 Tax=Nocardioides dongkuii TaxID=2760089 RepID=UPI0015FB59C5|nr:hypothetical protein [Nocardioides dongkuii]